MGLLIAADADTNLGSSKEIYLRIENINLNRTFGRVKVAVTYWVNQEYSENFKNSEERHPKGQILNKIILYSEENSELDNVVVDLPTLFEFNLTKPKEIKIPIYEIKEVTEEIPYIKFDEAGRRSTAFRTVARQVKVKIGEKNDITQVLDLDIESTLLSWCYGQIKASLAEIIPVEYLEDR